MRELDTKLIEEAVAQLCVQANVELTPDIEASLKEAEGRESCPLGRSILGKLRENLEFARQTGIPVCQDTGMAVVFAELGQEVVLRGMPFEEAVSAGVRRGYLEGCLRCSVVEDPLRRKNTGDNTPPILHTRIVPGDKVRLTVAPKGFGSETMSAVKMFNPSAKREEIVAFVKETVGRAGSNPCPPVVVGVGIGGNFEYAAYLAKRALLRPLDRPNPDPFYAQLEEEMLQAVNSLGIGPQGFGGDVTALAVNVERYPTHIAGLPVAVNMGCHVTRHATKTI